MEWSILKYGELNEAQKYEVVEIFIDGFGHFMTFTKDKNILRRLLVHAFNAEYTYVLVEENTVLGILGLATNKVRPLKFERDVCIELFGKLKGKILTKEMNAMFQSKVVKNDTDLYVDIVATSKESRGRGVATKLLEYSFSLKGYEKYYIEVMSKNTNAKRLYEKMGFVAYKKSKFSPLAFRGYGYPIKMKRVAE